MERKKLIIISLIIIFLVVGVMGYYQFTGNVVKEDTIKIGWMGPLTGQSSVLGIDGITAAEIAVDEINAKGGINGKKIELIVEDDSYDNKKSLDAYNKLVNIDKVDIILVYTYSAMYSLANKAKEDNVILFDPLDCNDEIAGLNNNTFCLSTDSEGIAKVLSNYANENHYEKMGILYYDSDLFMPLIKKYYENEYDGEIISEKYSVGTSDFRTPLLKMINQNVSGIVLLGYDEDGIAMKQARDLGFKGKFFMTGTVTSPGLIQASQGTSEGTIFAFFSAPKTQEPTKTFTEKFVKLKGREPYLDLACYPTYDSIYTLAKALNKTEDIEELKKEILNVNFIGVTGEIKFSPNHAMKIPEKIFVLRDGKPEKLED